MPHSYENIVIQGSASGRQQAYGRTLHADELEEERAAAMSSQSTAQTATQSSISRGQEDEGQSMAELGNSLLQQATAEYPAHEGAAFHFHITVQVHWAGTVA